jgi:hypothetical protein
MGWITQVDGKVVKSPVDIDALPAGRYRLVNASYFLLLYSFVYIYVPTSKPAMMIKVCIN